MGTQIFKRDIRAVIFMRHSENECATIPLDNYPCIKTDDINVLFIHFGPQGTAPDPTPQSEASFESFEYLNVSVEANCSNQTQQQLH